MASRDTRSCAPGEWAEGGEPAGVGRRATPTVCSVIESMTSASAGLATRSSPTWKVPLPARVRIRACPQARGRGSGRRSDGVGWRRGLERLLWGNADGKTRPVGGRRELRLGGRVEMWRGGSRFGLSVAAPFVWRCPSNLAIAPFPHPAHRTGHADLPHPALGQDITPSPTPGRGRVRSDVRAGSARKGARVDRPRPCVP